MAVQPKPVRPLAPRRGATPAPRARPRSDAAGAMRQTSAPAPAPPAVVRTSSGADEASRSSTSGEFLLLVFLIATLIMVAAVVLVGAVGQWWVLVPVMLVDLIAVFAVLVAIVQLLDTDG